MSHRDWLRAAIDAEPYWFHKMDLGSGLVTPGWSEPAVEKLPYFLLPEDLSGMRVLDIGCAEGYFSFEAERRGAAEVIGIDSFPDSVRRFNICRDALGARAQAFLTNVYDLSRRGFGTFDLVLYYGVNYHLRNPIHALENIFSVCSGTVLMQSDSFEDPALGDRAASLFHPFGIESGPPRTGNVTRPSSGCRTQPACGRCSSTSASSASKAADAGFGGVPSPRPRSARRVARPIR